MPFTEQQIKELQKRLDPRHVRQRQQAGIVLDYIEAWHAIAEANRIFGFDAWDRETVELKLVHEGTTANGKHIASYIGKVRITVRAGDDIIVREGCGFGQGIDKDPGRAHEGAIKECESDSMKRALMTFGNPFGLALYDKEKRNVGVDVNQDDVHTAAVQMLSNAKSIDALKQIWVKNAKEWKRLLSPDRFEKLETLKNELKEMLSNGCEQ